MEDETYLINKEADIQEPVTFFQHFYEHVTSTPIVSSFLVRCIFFKSNICEKLQVLVLKMTQKKKKKTKLNRVLPFIKADPNKAC